MTQALRPTGTMWHSFTTLDTEWSSSTQIASLDGASNRYVTSKIVAPWPNGAQYVHTTFDATDDTTRFVVFDRTTNTTRIDEWLNGYWRSADPCPSDLNVVKIITSATFSGDTKRLLIDVRTQATLKEVPSDRTFSWMADGHYLTVNAAGEIRMGSVTEADRVVGQLPALPAGHAISTAMASHDGRKLVIRLGWDDGASRFTDLWIANVDGTGFAQLTDTHAGMYAHWSPDDRFIAIEIDTGFVCASGGCIGSCQLWYTTPDQRMVKALNGTPGTWRFEFKNRNGSKTTQVTCGIIEWLR